MNKNAKDYIKTWIPGHYGEYGYSSEELWRKADTVELYEYATNKSVKMIRIGDFLFSIDKNDCLRIKQDKVSEEDIDLHINKQMTDYTSY